MDRGGSQAPPALGRRKGIESVQRQEATGLGRQGKHLWGGDQRLVSVQEDRRAQTVGLLPEQVRAIRTPTQRASQGDRLISKTDSGDYMRAGPMLASRRAY